MTKVEWKQHQVAVTSKYLGRMPETHKQAMELEGRIQVARKKALELAEEHQVEVDELDLPINFFSQLKSETDGGTDKSVVKPRSLTPKKCPRTWIQRSYIIFIHLHPALGAQDAEFTGTHTRVKINTLKGWLTKPIMVSCWLPVVSSFRACNVLSAMPPMYRDCFQEVDEDSTVSVKKFKRKANRFKGQMQINFTGNQVSVLLFFIVIISLN